MRGIEEEVMVNAGPGSIKIAHFDQRELMLVMFEAMIEIERPPGATIDEALVALARHGRLHDDLRRMAGAALDYFADRMRAAETERLQ